MKKKIFGGISALAIAAVAVWNVNLSSNEKQLSLMALANVEALAGESGSSSKCYSTVNYNSALGDSYKKSVKYCGSDCKYVYAHSYDGSC